MLSRSKVSDFGTSLSNPTLISFAKPRLDIRDKDLEDEEFQMEDTRCNPSLTEEIIRTEDLNIDWSDKEGVGGADDERAKVKSDEEVVGHMFGS